MILSLFLSAPFSLISLTYWACARTASLAIQAWWELLMAILGFFLDLSYKSMVWALAILTLPLRLFTALYREIKLEQQLREMKAQLESLACQNKELGQCLQVAVKETSMPLVAALLTVVGMSMGSVVNFFLAIKNKPASDAVVLLSINCFMLGALSRPALPRVAHAWGQCALRAAGWFFCRLGFSS